MRRIIGIEGSSFSGKTSSINLLRARRETTIPEYDEVSVAEITGEDSNPYKIIDSLITLEQARWRNFDQNPQNNPIFLDRTFLSFVTFEDVMIRFSRSGRERSLREGLRLYALERIHQLLEEGELIVPTQIIILRLNSKEFFQRRVDSRGVTPVPELSLFEAQQIVADKTEEYSESLLGSKSVATIVVDGMSRREVASGISSITKGFRHE